MNFKKIIGLVFMFFSLLSLSFAIDVNDTTGESITSSAPETVMTGLYIDSRTNNYLKEIEVAAGVDATTCYLKDSGFTTLTSTTDKTGDVFTFTPYQLTNGSAYFIVCDSGGSSYQWYYSGTGVSFPYIGTNIYINASSYNGGTQTNRVFMIDRILTGNLPVSSTPQINLNISDNDYFNISSINVSLNTSSTVNMSVYTNSNLTDTINDTNYTTTSINLIEGVNNLSFKSQDVNGVNWNNISVTLDTIKPNISIIGPITQDFEVNFSTVFNVTDNIGLSSCFINATYLENITNASQYDAYINCTDSYNFGAAGLYNGFLTATDNAGNIATLSINGTIEPFVFVNFYDISDVAITNYAATIEHPSGHIRNIVNTNNSINISPYFNGSLDLGSYQINFTKLGYQTLSVNISINETSGGESYNFTSYIATLLLNIYDIHNLSYITQNVNIDLIGTSFAGSFATSNGTITIYNVSDFPDLYELELISSGYETLNYYFTHTGYAVVNLSLYMQNTSTTIPIKYIIQDRFGDSIDTGCLVELGIYEISTNNYIPFVMGTTNSIGEVIFNLDTAERYKPQVTCDSVTQVYDGGKITSTPVYLKFTGQVLDIFDTIPRISSEITYTQLNNNSGRFTFVYNDLDNIVSQACLNITQISYNSETFINSTCQNGASGSLNLDFNTTKGLTYKAYGYVTYEGEQEEVNTYIHKVYSVDFNFAYVGILLSLILVAGFAIGGFFMGKAKGVLIGTTAALWIVSMGVLQLWNFGIIASLITWTVLLILGVVFS